MAEFSIRGVVPVLPTPFGQDGNIDHQALRDLVAFAAEAGACAVCLPAYASEFYKLSEREREEALATAIDAGRGRIPVIAQVNQPSLRLAREAAVRAAQAGATAINLGTPRLFPLSERDLTRYFDAILRAVDLPVVIQDFNPGGATIGAEFVAALHAQHPHFRYVKLEEALMAAKTARILQATGGSVGVIEGWGGMYILELIDAGICGVMPGLAIADVLARVFRLASGGDREGAYAVFRGVLPQIVFSLQNMELFHHAEKQLLEARGLLRSPAVREATVELNSHDLAHIRFLNGRVLALLDELGMPHNPLAARQRGA
jgi:dihydrodipicolinate synthase/N-acetylneuraminate lyase